MSNWLQRQMKLCAAEVATWPTWKRETLARQVANAGKQGGAGKAAPAVSSTSVEP